MSNDKTYLPAAIWGQLHALAWKDEKFCSALEADPTSTVRLFLVSNCGWSATDAANVRILKVTKRPEDMSDEHLESVVSGDQTAYVYADNSC